MVTGAPISTAEAAEWLDVLAVLAGDNPIEMRTRYLGADGLTPDIPGILQYAQSNADVFSDLLDPSSFAALNAGQKSAIERFLRYLEYLEEEQVADAEERDRRLLEAIEAYYADHQADAAASVINEIIIAIARVFGLEDQAHQLLGIERQDSENMLDARAAGAGMGSERGERAAQIAESLVGQRESGGNNRGAIVRLVSDGQEGQPWCGSFVRYVLNEAAPGLIRHDGLSARSYVDPAIMGDAVRGREYRPVPGDVIVFARGSGGHVGVVTSIESDGTVNYVAGNHGNAVGRGNFNPASSRGDFLGYLDVHALADQPGRDIDMGLPSGVTYVNNTRAPAHDPNVFAMG